MKLLNFLTSKPRILLVNPQRTALEQLEEAGKVEVERAMFSHEYKCSVALGDYSDLYVRIAALGRNTTEAAENCLRKYRLFCDSFDADAMKAQL